MLRNENSLKLPSTRDLRCLGRSSSVLIPRCFLCSHPSLLSRFTNRYIAFIFLYLYRNYMQQSWSKTLQTFVITTRRFFRSNIKSFPSHEICRNIWSDIVLNENNSKIVIGNPPNKKHHCKAKTISYKTDCSMNQSDLRIQSNWPIRSDVPHGISGYTGGWLVMRRMESMGIQDLTTKRAGWHQWESMS